MNKFNFREKKLTLYKVTSAELGLGLGANKFTAWGVLFFHAEIRLHIDPNFQKLTIFMMWAILSFVGGMIEGLHLHPCQICEMDTSLKPVWVPGTNLTQFGYHNFGITVWVLVVGLLISYARGV